VRTPGSGARATSVRTRDEVSQNRTLQDEIWPTLPSNSLKINPLTNKQVGSPLALNVFGELRWIAPVH
jgi:hypothetical protein